MTKKKLISFMFHVALFVGVELLFVFLVLREIPRIEFATTLGIIHLVYLVLVLAFGIWRETVKKLRAKIILTYTPVVLHVAGHVYAGFLTVAEIHEHIEDHHDEHSIMWLVIATVSIGVLVVLGEWLLHRKLHCDHCHTEVHKHCKED